MLSVQMMFGTVRYREINQHFKIQNFLKEFPISIGSIQHALINTKNDGILSMYAEAESRDSNSLDQ